MKTVSLELSKALKEAGVEIKTEYTWFSDPYKPEHVHARKYAPNLNVVCPAPTTDELLEWLPFGASVMKALDVDWKRHCYHATIIDADNPDNKKFYADTPADALAKLALWVKEEK